MRFAAESDPLLMVEDLLFPAGPYQLQGELAYPTEGAPIGAAVIAGPHPLLGGDLHNNVVRGLGDGLAERGLATLRFNYRGVGRSQGPPVDVARHLADFWATSHVPDEIDYWQDVQGAVVFLSQVVGHSLPLALTGYSFGCSLLPHVRPPVERVALAVVAPTLGKHSYDTYAVVPYPTLVVAATDDFAMDAGTLEEWFRGLTMPKRLIRREGDNHFFRGHEDWLTATVFDFLQDQWRELAC